jgi:hypothetical protein
MSRKAGYLPRPESIRNTLFPGTLVQTMPRAPIHALAAALLFVSACTSGEPAASAAIAVAHAAGQPPIPSASQPTDPDLELGRSCRSHPGADDLAERLPTYVKELVVMWPRAGRMKDAEGRCRTVARLTVLNHQGVPITVSFIFHGSDERPQTQDYRLLEGASPPRAVMDLVASDEHPHVLVEAAGAPSTSRDALEGLLEFLHPEQLVVRLVGGS